MSSLAWIDCDAFPMILLPQQQLICTATSYFKFVSKFKCESNVTKQIHFYRVFRMRTFMGNFLAKQIST